MALMKILANEGAPHGILVNGMLVGLIDSDQHRRRHATAGSNAPYEEFTAKMGANVPLGRIGKAEEFAAMACFLCSDLPVSPPERRSTWTAAPARSSERWLSSLSRTGVTWTG